MEMFFYTVDEATAIYEKPEWKWMIFVDWLKWLGKGPIHRR